MKIKKVIFIKDKPRAGFKSYNSDSKYVIDYEEKVNTIGQECFDSSELIYQVNKHLREGFEILIKQSSK